MAGPYEYLPDAPVVLSYTQLWQILRTAETDRVVVRSGEPLPDTFYFNDTTWTGFVRQNGGAYSVARLQRAYWADDEKRRRWCHTEYLIERRLA